MNNIHNVEKTMQKYQQLAKDAQSNGDPVMAQNYLQHADHFARILQSREIVKDLDSNSSNKVKKTSKNNDEEISSTELNISD